jgi:hypothetical protein
VVSHSSGQFATGETIDCKTRLQYRNAADRGMEFADPFRSQESTESPILAAVAELVDPDDTITIKRIDRNLTPSVI